MDVFDIEVQVEEGMEEEIYDAIREVYGDIS